jgi:hypothetical protein
MNAVVKLQMIAENLADMDVYLDIFYMFGC